MNERGVVALLFTDIVGSSRLFEELGDEAAEALTREHFRVLREAVASHGGTEVKSLGDGLMVAFPSAVSAADCAAAMQDAVAGRTRRQGDTRLGLRVGLHAGEPLREQEDYFGSAVVVANRLCDAASEGQILASEVVRGLVGSRGDHGFRAVGDLELKGIDEPVRAWEVLWEERARPTTIQLCGDFRVEVEGRRLERALPGRQGRLLLAYLAAHRDRPVSRDELIGVLWPERPPASPDAALRVPLSKLRRALGRGAVEGRSALSLVLPPDARIDVEDAATAVGRAEAAIAASRWQEAAEAAELAGGIAARPLLPEFEGDWIEERRRDLEELRLSALEYLAQAQLRLGGAPHLAAAERAARSLIEQAPFRESGYAYLMEANAARGNVAEALQVYELVRCLLRDELGTTPSVRLKELHERLLTDGAPLAPAAEASAAEAAPRPVAAAPGGPLPLAPLLESEEAAPFVGRESDLARLREQLDNARSGRRAVVFLAGEPGIGKTRLAREFVRTAHKQGATVLWGRCFEEALVPYEALIAPLRHYVVNCPQGALKEQLDRGGGELRRLVPELEDRVPDLPEPVTGDPDGERYRLFEAVAELLGNASRETPLVLVLDDVHWADRDTLLLLKHLTRAVEQSKLLVVCAYRDTDPGREHVLELLAELHRDRRAERIALGGLDEEESGEFVAAHSDGRASTALARRLHEETDGNPFFLEELVRHLAESQALAAEAREPALAEIGIPEAVKDVIAARVSRLGEPAREALSAGAVIGRDFAADVVEKVTGISGDELIEALEDAQAAGLVTELPDAAEGSGFAHALIQETLYEGLSKNRRVRLHQKVGAALVEIWGDDPGERLPEFAYHFLRAGSSELENAVRYSLAAGRQAMEVVAYEEAAEHFERALEALERKREAPQRRCEALLALGEARLRTRDVPAAKDAFRRAADLAAKAEAPEQLARAALGFGGGVNRFGPAGGLVDDELVGLLETAVSSLGGRDGPLRAMCLARLATELHWSDKDEERRDRLSREALDIARRIDDSAALAFTLTARRFATWGPDNLDARLRLSTETLRLADELDDKELRIAGQWGRIIDLMEAGDVAGADAEAESHASLATERRVPYHMWWAAMFRAGRAIFEGRLDDADGLAQEAFAAGERILPDPDVAHGFAVQVLYSRRDRGQLADLAQPVAEFAANHPTVPGWRAALAMVYAEAGRRREARAEFERVAARDFSDWPRDLVWINGLALASEVCTFLADARRAACLYELLFPHAGKNIVVGGAMAYQGPVSRYLGLLAMTCGRLPDAIEHFEHALGMCTRMGARPDEARTRCTYGEALLRRAAPGDRERGQGLIEAGLALARDLGMEKLAADTAALLADADRVPSAPVVAHSESGA